MSDIKLIKRHLTVFFPDNHQAVYLYCAGNVKSRMKAFKNILEATSPIFSPPISILIIKKAIYDFLEDKKNQYLKGEITIKSVY